MDDDDDFLYGGGDALVHRQGREHDSAQPKRPTDCNDKRITHISCNRVCIDCFAESRPFTSTRKAEEPDSRQSYTPEPMNFDGATEPGGDTTEKDTATAAPPASGDDDEEMDEESSEDVCTNLLTHVMHNIPYFLTLRRVP